MTQDGIDLTSLRKCHHLLALDTVGLGTGGFLRVDADDLEAATHSLYPKIWLINGIIRLDEVKQMSLDL